MENLNNNELIFRLQDILDDVKMASLHLEAGKEILSHRQLQGVRTKLVDFINLCGKKTSSEKNKNVAKTTNI